MTPLVSILMPIRNVRPYVAEAVGSVLNQSYRNLELIVVEDGSTDGSGDVVARFNDSRIRLIPGPQTGVGNALNVGLEAARGELIARCDGDDLYVDQRVQWQVQWLADHPDFIAVCGGFGTIDPRGRPVADLNGHLPAEEITPELNGGTTRTSLATFTLRTEAVKQIGGFRPWFISAEDIDLQFRLAEVGRIWFEPRNSYLYRLHGSSLTHTQPSAARVFYEETARLFQQQRRQGRQDDLALGTPPEPPAGSTSACSPVDQIQGLLVGRSWREHRAGQRLRSLATGLRACCVRPGSGYAWKSLAALLIRPSSERNGNG